METLGERLKYARELKGLTQEDLHKRSGVSQQTIGHLEKRKSKKSGFSGDLANALGVNLRWLQSGFGEMEGDASGFTNSSIQIDPKTLPVVPLLEYSDLLDIDGILQSHYDGSQRKKEFSVLYSPPGSFLLSVTNDANSPEFRTEDLVLIDRNSSPEPGQFVLVRRGDRLVIGKFKEISDTRYSVHSLTDTFSYEFDEDGAESVLGVIVSMVRDMRKI